MITHLALAYAATTVPRCFSGEQLHHLALAAAHQGENGLADRLFAHAVERYREELRVEPLARLRVHQLMIEVLNHVRPADEHDLILAIERRLANLETIEAIEPPFALVEARSLLANWRDDAAAKDDVVAHAA